MAELSIGPFTFAAGRKPSRPAAAPVTAQTVQAGSSMASLLSGMRQAGIWGFPRETTKLARLQSYTGYIMTCVSARARREARPRIVLTRTDRNEPVPQEDNPIAWQFFHRPNPAMNRSFFYMLLSVLRRCAGASPILIIRNGAGAPMAQWPLLPHRIQAFYDAVDFVRYEYTDDSGKTTRIAAKDLIYPRDPHPLKPMDSVGMVEAAGLFGDTDTLLWEYERQMFADGPFVRWIIESTGDTDPDPDLMDLLAKKWAERVRDRSRLAEPLMVGNGKARRADFGNAGLEVPTINEEVKERIRSAIQISKTILGEVPGESRANVEGADFGFAQTVDDYTESLAEAYNHVVVPQWDARLHVGFTSAVPDDKDYRLREEESRLRSKVWTINDVHRRLGEEEVEYGNKPWGSFGDVQIGGGIEPVGSAAEPAPAPVGAAPAGDVAKTALNGAQVQALVQILGEVAAGRLSPEAAVLAILQAFPDFDEAAVRAMVKAIEIKPPSEPAPVAPAAALSAESARTLADDKEDPAIRRRRELMERFLAFQGTWERRVEAVVKARFKAESAEVVRRIEKLVPAFLPQLAEMNMGRAKHYFMTDPHSIAKRIADTTDFRKPFVDEVSPVLVAMYTEAGQRVVKDLGGKMPFKVSARGIKRIGNHLSKSTDQVLQTTSDKIVTALEEGFLKGEGVGALSSRIRDLYDGMSSSRALMIARTETVAPANLGTLDAGRQEGATIKEWITTMDGHARADHEAVNGVKMELDVPFLVGGEALDFPGDEAGSAENVINCRCSCVVLGADGAEGGV